jgi:CRP-like cAMP-binding protein
MASKSKCNSILESLPSREFAAISKNLEPVALSKDAALFRPGKSSEYLFFPTGSVISFIGDAERGGGIEICSVGSEGAAGISGVLGRATPFLGVVQVSGTALRARSSVFRDSFKDGNALHDVFLRYYHYLVIQISYLGICNNRHPLVQRLSRWLLVMEQRVGASTLEFTQDSIAGLLGTRRATISVAAAQLQSAGLIRYTPGAITIKSRRELRKVACGCYKVINPKLG